MLAKRLLLNSNNIRALQTALTKQSRFTTALNYRQFSSVSTNEDDENMEQENVSEIFEKISESLQPQKKMSIEFLREADQLNSFPLVKDFYESNNNNLTLSQQLHLYKKMVDVMPKNYDNQTKLQATSIQTKIITQALSNKVALDVYNTNTLLLAMFTSKLDMSIVSKKDLVELEQHIKVNLNEFMKMDMSLMLAAFMKQGFVPEKLIEEVGKMNELSTFYSEGIIVLLDQMINIKMISNSEMYEKLLNRIDQIVGKSNSRTCQHLIFMMDKYQQLFPQHQNTNITRMQSYIDRQCENYSYMHRGQNMTHRIQQTLNCLKKFNEDIQNNLSDVTLNTEEFYNVSTNLLVKQIEDFKPSSLLNLLYNFEDSSQQQQIIVKQTLNAMREDKYDVRQFNFGQLSHFVQYVADYQPKDLHVFSKFINTAIEQNFYSDDELNKMFSFVKLVQAFALNDQIQDGPLMYKFMIMLSDNLDKSSFRQNMIGLIWTLISRDISSANEPTTSGKAPVSTTGTNPLIPRLLEQLYSYERETPLSRNEYLMLFQINIWIQEKVSNGRLPEQFAKCIPAGILDAAEHKYQEYDRPQFSKVQTEIAKKLLELRVTFRENQKVNQLYRADIKLENQKTVIMLHSETSQTKNRLLGLDKIKYNYMNVKASEEYDVKLIDVDQWQRLDKFEQLLMMSEMTASSSNKNSLRA